VGHAGLEAERRADEERLRAEAEARKRGDRERAEERRLKEREAAGSARLAQLIRGGWIREATAGSRRFFFVAKGERISYLDLSDVAARLLSLGAAAIVETRGFVRGEHCVVSDRAASEISQLHPELIRFWNRGGGGTE